MSKEPLEELLESGFAPIPCDCGSSDCSGWETKPLNRSLLKGLVDYLPAEKIGQAYMIMFRLMNIV